MPPAGTLRSTGSSRDRPFFRKRRRCLRAARRALEGRAAAGGELEDLLVERIIAAYSRLRRLGRVEAGMFTWEHYEELSQQAQQEARSYEQYAKLTELLRQLNWEIPDEGKQKHQEALSRAQAMKGQARHTNCLAWQNLIRGTDKANAFSKLSRYETAIERSLYKALHELQRLTSRPNRRR